MTSIEEALDALFTYKRTQCQLRAKLVQESYGVKGIGHLNVVVSNENLGFTGVIPIIGEFGFKNEGTTIAYYTAEENLTSEGPKLPHPFENYNDSPKVHYGLLLNCLAYMHGGRVQRLALVQMKDHAITSMMIKPAIAEYFLSNLSQIKKKKEVVILKGKAKKKYVDPNQVGMFSNTLRTQ